MRPKPLIARQKKGLPPSARDGASEVRMTDPLGDLSGEQVDRLSTRLDDAYGVTLQAAEAPAWMVTRQGCFWLGGEEGAAVLVVPDHTVEQIWASAARASAAMDETKEEMELP